MPNNKFYKIILFGYFICQWSFLQCQTTLTFAEADSIGYSLYNQGAWNKLEKYSEKVIASNIDYYYLRMRAGVACFEQKKYRVAIVHFKQALLFNSNDEIAFEYLYLCLIYTSRFEEAKNLSSNFSEAFAKYMQLNNKNNIDLILIESGTKLPNNSLFKRPIYGQLGLNHYLLNHTSLFHSISYYHQNEWRFSVNQLQYYVGTGTPLKKNWFLSTGSHFIYHSADYYKYYNSTSVVNSALTYTTKTGFALTRDTTIKRLIQYEINTVDSYPVNAKAIQFAAAINFTKRTKLYDLTLGTTINLLDTVTQIQLNSSISFYPFYNNNVSFGGSFYPHISTQTSSLSLAGSLFASIKFQKKWQFTFSYFFNNGLNIAERNAYLVNNSFDRTPQRLSFIPSFQINKKVGVYGVIGYESKKETIYSYNYGYWMTVLGLKYTPF